jgi:hypothetical protein
MKSTKGSKGQSMGAPQVCAGCGMEKSEWTGQGYDLGAKRYCCEGCADGTGCTCDNPQLGRISA